MRELAVSGSHTVVGKRNKGVNGMRYHIHAVSGENEAWCYVAGGDKIAKRRMEHFTA